ncbi:hypothetical protein VHA01S_016_00230 [Vibrio halioticoli NBRC 102217]|uniref:Zinc ribbon domain-containing protein n=1 Tax=Vibrio halioticoli NBRC 102217 TaxID=1219072 RepID=V5FH17_9VIBR|nr:hypothetical protein VHA01S_016_00230 [Vibrio halioticoli NBRC 102217]
MILFWLCSWIFLSLYCGIYASRKGRSGLGFFLIALLFSPIISFILALIFSPTQSKVEEQAMSSGELRKCPMCAESIKSEAIICKHCGSKIDTDEEFFDENEESGYQYQIMVNGEDIIAFDVSKSGTPDNIDRAKAKGFKERGVVFADNAIEAIKIYSES